MRFATSPVALVALAACLGGCRGNIAIGGLPSPEGGPDSGDDGAADVSAEGGASGSPCAEIEARSLQIRRQSCAQCHGISSPGIAFNYVLDDEALVSTNGPGFTTPLVIPGNPASSPLWQRVEAGFEGYALGMPPAQQYATAQVSPATAATIVYPTTADLSTLGEWIQSCVPGADGGADASSSYGNAGSDAAADVSLAIDSGGLVDVTDGGTSSVVPGDAQIDVDAAPAPPGLAGFALVVDGALQTPMTCPTDNWEFWPVNGAGQPVCDPNSWLCPNSAVLINVGQTTLAYTARSSWSVPYPPGVATGEPDVLVGVLAPGDQVDISSAFVGDVSAIVGSSAPFSSPDGGRYIGDEGTIPWPPGVAGSGGATQMWVAQIDMRPSCMPVSPYW